LHDIDDSDDSESSSSSSSKHSFNQLEEIPSGEETTISEVDEDVTPKDIIE